MRRPCLFLVLLLSACIPAQVKDLNLAGDRALADRKYEQAQSYYARSLALYPDQNEIRLRLDSVQTLLRQIYVDQLYETVDNPGAPVGEYLSAWQVSAKLPSVNVPAARVASIRADLSRRFAKSEKRLRARTEGHVYYLHLTSMEVLVPDPEVRQAIAGVGATLRDEHLRSRKDADSANRAGLGLLHTVAAATFSPSDTGLWADADRRRAALLKSLAISVGLNARAAAGGASASHLLGEIRRRLPPIFVVASSAPLQLSLEARPPVSDERRSDDRRSADCKVGTRQVPNPECPALRRQAEAARGTVEAQKRTADAVSARCAQEAQASSCTSAASDAQRRLNDAQRDYQDLESRVGRCPEHLEQPVFQTFFYMVHLVQRQVTASGNLTLTRAGTVQSSRGVQGTAAAQDTYGDGLGCANIAADPLQLPSLAGLRLSAEDAMLQDSLRELHQMRRQRAQDQMAGGDSPDERLDSLVRARLVDDTFDLAREQLLRTLATRWGSDFKVTDKVVR